MLAVLPIKTDPTSVLLPIGIWIGLSLVLTYLVLTKKISGQTAKWSALLFIALGAMWLYHGPHRHAAKRWWDGGLQVSIACAHSRECVSWLMSARPDENGIFPGQQTHAQICKRDDLKALFGSALPCATDSQ